MDFKHKIWFGVLVALITTAYAFVHDGKSYALEAAIEELERQDNPYTLREAWWSGETAAGKSHRIKHQLFKRNEYWFWLGASDEDAVVQIHIYDDEGNLVENESFERGNVAGARILPEKTGAYNIIVNVSKAADDVTEWAVIYAFR